MDVKKGAAGKPGRLFFCAVNRWASDLDVKFLDHVVIVLIGPWKEGGPILRVEIIDWLADQGHGFFETLVFADLLKGLTIFNNLTLSHPLVQSTFPHQFP
jgi:hypothetical protein